MKFKNTPVKRFVEDQYKRARVIHTAREYARIYKRFIDIPWSEAPTMPRRTRPIKIDKSGHTVLKTIRELRERGVIITQAITVDGQIYEIATRLTSGPSKAILETSLNRWRNLKTINEDTIHDYISMMVAQGWTRLLPHEKTTSIFEDSNKYYDIAAKKAEERRIRTENLKYTSRVIKRAFTPKQVKTLDKKEPETELDRIFLEDIKSFDND